MVVVAIVLSVTVFLCVVVVTLLAFLEGFAVQRPWKGAAGVSKLLRGAQNVPRSKPNTNSLWSLGRYHGKASGTPSKAAAEGFDVQRPSKAAAGVLRLLRGAQNVPRSSFEAQCKQLVGPREVPWQSQRDAFESCCGGFCGSKAFESCCGGFEAFKGRPKRASSSFEAQRKQLVRPREYHSQSRRAHSVSRSSFEAQCKQLVGPREVPWQSQRDAFESCCGGFCGSKAFESCCGGFEAFKGRPKRASSSFEAQRKQLVRPREYHSQSRRAQSVSRSSFEAQCKQLVGPREVPWQSRRDALQAAAEGFAVQRPSKAAARVLRLLRGAQNVPRSSFEAKSKQPVGPREVPWQRTKQAQGLAAHLR